MGSEKDFKIIEYFESEEEFGGDSSGYGVSYKNEIIKKFGDDYHEKGRDRSEAFIFGMCYAKGIDINIHRIEHIEEVEE